MSTHKPDELDYDEELFEKLRYRRLATVVRLYNAFAAGTDNRKMSRGAHTQEEFRKIIASEFQDQLREFFDYYEELDRENVGTQAAIDYLNNNYELDREDLDIENRYQLLVLLYETGIVDNISELVDRTSIRPYRTRRSFTFEQSIDISEVEHKLSQFHNYWNIERKEVRPLRIEIQDRDDGYLLLRLNQEFGEKKIDVFEFREGSDDLPAVPDVTRVGLWPLKNMRFEIETEGDMSNITFTDSLTGWQRTLDSLFYRVFGIDEITNKISEKRFDAVKELEEEIASGIGEAKDPVQFIQDNVNERRSKALDRVDKKNLPDTQKEELKEKIESIELSGGDILDDQSTSTEEFRMVAFSLEDLFSAVDGSQEVFQDYLSKADRENQAFVLTIENRPVQVKDGNWDPQGRISELNEKALKIFFDQDIDEDEND